MRRRSAKWRLWVIPLCAIGTSGSAAWVIHELFNPSDLFAPKHLLLILLIVLLVFAGNRLRNREP